MASLFIGWTLRPQASQTWVIQSRVVSCSSRYACVAARPTATCMHRVAKQTVLEQRACTGLARMHERTRTAAQRGAFSDWLPGAPGGRCWLAGQPAPPLPASGHC
jgi:hypothetical protein